jgi:hypothetical protein
VTELLGLEEKIFVQGVCYFINNIHKFIYRKLKEVYGQNINSIFLELIHNNSHFTSQHTKKFSLLNASNQSNSIIMLYRSIVLYE